MDSIPPPNPQFPMSSIPRPSSSRHRSSSFLFGPPSFSQSRSNRLIYLLHRLSVLSETSQKNKIQSDQTMSRYYKYLQVEKQCHPEDVSDEACNRLPKRLEAEHPMTPHNLSLTFSIFSTADNNTPTPPIYQQTPPTPYFLLLQTHPRHRALFSPPRLSTRLLVVEQKCRIQKK